MKKLLAMVLAAVMVLSLCSCATAEETVALRVWVGDNADLPWINGVIENFKAAHPEKTYTSPWIFRLRATAPSAS